MTTTTTPPAAAARPALPAGWAGAIEAYARFMGAAGRRPLTIRQHRWHIGNFAAASGLGLADVTELHLLEYLAGQDWTPNTRKSARGHLRGFFAWATRTGLTEHNPAGELPTVRVPAGTPHPIGEADLARAITAGTDAQQLALLLGAYAGLRRAEIAAVHPRDLQDGRLRVPAGKGGKGRTLPAHPLIVKAVEAEQRRRASGVLGSGFRYRDHDVTPGLPLFVGQQRNQAMTVGSSGQLIVDHFTALGIEATAHSLRHRFATRAYAGSRDLRAVQERSWATANPRPPRAISPSRTTHSPGRCRSCEHRMGL